MTLHPQLPLSPYAPFVKVGGNLSHYVLDFPFRSADGTILSSSIKKALINTVWEPLPFPR